MIKEVEEKINLEYFCLGKTAFFLDSQIKKKHAELIYLNKCLEKEYSDDLFARYQKVLEEYKNLEKKVNWEKKQCAVFDKKMENLNELKSVEFISNLSKKILSKRFKNKSSGE